MSCCLTNRVIPEVTFLSFSYHIVIQGAILQDFFQMKTLWISVPTSRHNKRVYWNKLSLITPVFFLLRCCSLLYHVIPNHLGKECKFPSSESPFKSRTGARLRHWTLVVGNVCQRLSLSHNFAHLAWHSIAIKWSLEGCHTSINMVHGSETKREKMSTEINVKKTCNTAQTLKNKRKGAGGGSDGDISFFIHPSSPALSLSGVMVSVDLGKWEN